MQQPRSLLILLLLLCACACGRASASDDSQMRVAFGELATRERPTLPLPWAHEQAKEKRRTLPQQDTAYPGWNRWCESFEPAPCKAQSDCAKVSTPDGKPLRCVKPWWAAKGEDTKVCASRWPARREQAWRRARVAEIISEICSGPGCDERSLSAFVSIVAGRESTWRPWKSHRLNGDVRANRIAWQRLKDEYRGNPHYASRERWQGYGLFGQNSALFVHLWDRQAPPEVLCREVEAVATYLERAKIAARKQADLGVAPTWATVHAALASGEVRPSARALDRFRAQANKTGLDADRAVTSRSFGRGLGRTVAARRLAAELLRAHVDAKLGDRPERAERGS